MAFPASMPLCNNGWQEAMILRHWYAEQGARRCAEAMPGRRLKSCDDEVQLMDPAMVPMPGSGLKRCDNSAALVRLTEFGVAPDELAGELRAWWDQASVTVIDARRLVTVREAAREVTVKVAE